MGILKTLTIVLVAFVCCSLAGLGSQLQHVDDFDEVEKGDEFVDHLVKDMMEERGHEYDPYLMEDSNVSFHRKIGFVNITGEAKLHGGYMTGLRSLYRTGHCSLRHAKDRLGVRADLGAGVLNFHYSGSVLFMSWGPTVTVHGELAYVEVEMKFSVDAETGQNGHLDEFNIDDMRGMKVWITGLGPLNWAVNPIISGVTRLFKRYIRNALENRVGNYIAQRLPNYKFPVPELTVSNEIE